MSPSPADGVRFDLALPARVWFGAGRAADIPVATADMASRVFVTTGSDPGRHRSLLHEMADVGLRVETFPAAGEPTVEVARAATERAREHGSEAVVAIGGGSTLDLGKAVAMLLANGGDPLDYLEVIGRGNPITEPSRPLLLAPTTAGSGSEVTSNAVLGSPEHRVKVSLRSPLMLARLAVVDPLLTLGAPPATTAASGLDALTQCLEPYVSRMANPASDAFARAGLARAARALRRVVADGSDVSAREDMAVGSLMGGLALSNAKLGAVHGIAGPFGGMFDSPHGAVCAALLAPVMSANVRAMRERDADSPALPRYRELARVLTGDPGATFEDGLAWVRGTVDALGVPGLSTYGLQLGTGPGDADSADLTDLVTRSLRSSSMKGNPITLTREETADVVRSAAAW